MLGLIVIAIMMGFPTAFTLMGPAPGETMADLQRMMSQYNGY